MQIFITRTPEDFSPTDRIRGVFDGKTITIYNGGHVIYQSEAQLGECYKIVEENRQLVVTKQTVPETVSGKVARILSFDQSKICSDPEDFLMRTENIRSVYPGRGFIIDMIPNAYGFMVAKKKDRNFYAPLLLWVSEDISKENLKRLLKKYKKYRKIYFPKHLIPYLIGVTVD